MTKLRVYICGKISGLPIEIAKARFSNAAKKLEQLGYNPINPMELNHNHNKSWEAYMKVCIAELVKCDYIHLIMEDIYTSKGACLEIEIANKLNIPTLVA